MQQVFGKLRCCLQVAAACATEECQLHANDASCARDPTSVRYSPSGTRIFQVLYSMSSSGSPMACSTCASGLAALPAKSLDANRSSLQADAVKDADAFAAD